MFFMTMAVGISSSSGSELNVSVRSCDPASGGAPKLEKGFMLGSECC